MKSFLFFLCVLTAALLCSGCVGGSKTLQPGEQHGTTLAAGHYIFDTQRISHEHDGELFYKDGLARVAPEGRGGYRVTLLEQRGGNFGLANRGGTLTIVDDQMAFGNVERVLKGDGIILMGNFARGDCQIKLRNVGRRDFRKGTWTLRPASPEELKRLKR